MYIHQKQNQKSGPSFILQVDTGGKEVQYNNLIIWIFPLLLTNLREDLIFDIKLVSTILSNGSLERDSIIIL